MSKVTFPRGTGRHTVTVDGKPVGEVVRIINGPHLLLDRGDHLESDRYFYVRPEHAHSKPMLHAKRQVAELLSRLTVEQIYNLKRVRQDLTVQQMIDIAAVFA